MAKIIANQLLIAGSFLLAALLVGCSVGYPSVLLHQLRSNNSSIQLDWETSTWIGSIHGIAATPSILMPAFMQWQGRKLAFILACVVSIAGWIMTFTAPNSTYILISESLQGFGSQSIMAVGMLSMSEMLAPEIRNASMGSYLVMQTLGMSLLGIIGSCVNWRTAAVVVCAPLILITVIVATVWPESPSWLAYKGEFDKCEKSFKRLRGTGDTAQTELKELILAQKEIQSRDNNNQNAFKTFWQTLKSRDFYLPVIHIFILFESMYWTGGLPLLIYSSVIIQRATNMTDSVLFGNITLNVMIFIGCITSIALTRYFQPKRILFGSSLCAVTCMLSASVVSYCQTVGVLTKESYLCLYFLVCFIYVMNIGSPIIITLTAELMPVKHRGIGGPLYVMTTCFLHTSVLKVVPYLFEYINLWGTFLVFAINGFSSHLYIWFYVPETKGKTLQQLEDFYSNGNINKRRRVEQQETLSELISNKQ